jgi:uncharacterized protein (DUF488 family)
MPLPFHTIGHSTRTIDDFVALLREAEVRLVVDVRTVPRSRTNPQYNKDMLPDTLAQFQIGYEHIAELGGLRGKKRDVPPDVNGFWQNASFHNYADYALSESFRHGLARLREIGHATPCAIMCAEAVWWRCHRRIITDYLLAAGETVFHILGPGHVEPAHVNEGAVVKDHSLTYPALL